MTTRMTKNGMSTTSGLGQEKYEYFQHTATLGMLCQYDYRHTDGSLFSCVKRELEDCRTARDAWLAKKESSGRED